MWGRIDVNEIQQHPNFWWLYSEISDDILSAGYEAADSPVAGFAIEHDCMSWDVWQAVAYEASMRGDVALEAMAENPPGGGTPQPEMPLAISLAVLAFRAARAWKGRR